jgi:hypothetical protein
VPAHALLAGVNCLLQQGGEISGAQVAVALQVDLGILRNKGDWFEMVRQGVLDGSLLSGLDLKEVDGVNRQALGLTGPLATAEVRKLCALCINLRLADLRASTAISHGFR